MSIDNFLLDEIALVSDEQLVDALGGVAVDFLKPLLDVVEGVHIGDVIDDDDAVCTAVVRGGDGTEALLSGRVPNLELDSLSFELDGANFLQRNE